MPAKSQAQLNFMRMCEHSPQHAYGKCPSKKVAHEFAKAPKGKRLPRRKRTRSAHKALA